MQEQLVRFLAALSNARARLRFAEIDLGGRHGVPAEPTADRLLLSAGIVEELPGGLVRVDDSAIKALLAHARSSLPPKPEPKLEQLPRQHEPRFVLLGRLAERILGFGEHVSERELNARLAEFVVDVPRVRRAMVDDGVLARELDGSSYWRSALPPDGSEGTG